MEKKDARRMLCYRIGLSLAALLLLAFTGGETEKIAPFALVFILAISAGLAFLRDTRLLTLPFLLLCLLLIFCYDSYDVFIKYIWFVPVPLIAIAVHIIRLRPHLAVGRAFFPLIAVALATPLGGLGRITAAEYFSPVALFYVFALGPGLVLVYLLLKNELRTDVDERSLLADLAALSLTAAAVVYGWQLYHLPQMLSGQYVIEPQWSNNIATLLMLSFPALLWRARHQWRYLPLGLLAGGAAMLSGSNGGLFLGGVEIVACLFCLFLADRRRSFRCVTGGLLIAAALLAVGGTVWLLTRELAIDLRYAFQSRTKLFWRGMEDFAANPLFGTGLGYRGNADLYNGKMGTINWYHLFVAQVLGGLGLVGALAWGYQLAVRARLAWSAWGQDRFALALCYLGLFLMSMVNPGEFCPVPYAFLAVAFFVLLERQDKTPFVPFWHRLKAKEEKECSQAPDRESG